MAGNRGLDSGAAKRDNGGVNTQPEGPRNLWDIAHSGDAPLPEGFDVNDYEVRNPVTGKWEEVEELFVADEHSVDFGDDEPEAYIDLTTSGDHYTVGPDDNVEIRRKPAAGEDTGSPEDTNADYNRAIFEEAVDYQSVNTEDAESDDDYGPDEELDAQIEILRGAMQRGDQAAANFAADHLRRMLTFGYADDDELPPPPAGRVRL
jgi:hypothetical protein